jgi:hypothetical protein
VVFFRRSVGVFIGKSATDESISTTPISLKKMRSDYMTERNPVRDAVRYALTAGVAASFVGAPAATLAQDDVAVQDKVTVTGSRIKRVDIEG